jgi:glycosyltransferase involved in cell wall biosynthesis
VNLRFFPADDGAPSLYRHREPARIAREQGHQTRIESRYIQIGLGEQAHRPGERFIPATPVLGEDGLPREENGRVLVEPIICEVAILQRPAKPVTVPLIEAFHRMNTAVVVDLDDDFSCLHPNHPHAQEFRETNHHLVKACALADMVTVTSDALAERYGPHGRVAVLPNCMPERVLELPRSSDGSTLGWSGAPHMHLGDLEVVGTGVREALERSGWHFKLVGDAQDARHKLGDIELQDTGWLDMEEWYLQLGSLDVGIVPLGDTAFNRAKSYLKGLEYAARGVPFVASDVAEYRKLAEEGLGSVVAARGRNWRSALLRLMDDDVLRAEVAAQGLQIVREHHTYEGEGWRWLEVWEQALQARRGRLAA